MKALSVTGARQMEVLNTELPQPAAHEVLIRVAYCGICGSDFPRYFDGAVHAFPQVLGHEFSGTVESVGQEVSSASVGDRVVVAPLVPCRTCAECSKGRPALCTQYSFVGSRQQGALAQYVAVPAENVVPIPPELSLRDAALVEPLTVAIHGIDQVPLRTGDRAVVFGAGVIGLLTVMALKARGAGHVVAVDVQQDKLDLARELGADEAVLGSAAEEYFKQAPAPQLAVETAGHPTTQVDAVRFCAKGGSVVYVGTSTRDVTFPSRAFEQILRKELHLVGSWMSYSAPFPGYEWTAAVQMVAEGAVQVKPLISKVYALEDAAQPFEDVRKAQGTLLKVLYAPGGDLG